MIHIDKIDIKNINSKGVTSNPQNADRSLNRTAFRDDGLGAKAGRVWVIPMGGMMAITLTLMLSIVLSSCEKYLDIKSTNTQTPITTVAECQELMNDLGLNAGTLEGLISAEEFYLNDDQYNSDNTQLSDKQLYTWNTSALGESWTGFYQIVYRVNVVLESLEKIAKKGNNNAAALNDVRGQALFFRAFCFWHLAQLYTKPYNVATAGTDPGIPLRLSADINDKSIRGTVQQTYNRILQDLNESASLLEASFTVPTRPVKRAAYAMLARIYMDMENYPDALSNANEALKGAELMDLNDFDKASGSPFPRYNKEVIFHAVSGGSGILNSTESAKIDLDLLELYAENDLRKNILFNENMMSVPDPIIDNPDNTKEVPDGTYRFTGNYDPTAGDQNFFVGLAVDELMLIRAECYARAGNTTAAMGDLNTLLATRWVTGTYIPMSASGADDALAKVILERRKELVFRGTRWNDLRRLNKDSRFAQTLSRTAAGVTYTLPPNDPRYTLLIPLDAVNRGGIEQNKR